jgi:hypothetical protein
VQLHLRRTLVKKIRSGSADIWPIDPAAALHPQAAQVRWPENKEFALVLTHDVDTWRGAKYCETLARIEKDLGFRSSFNFVPERYPIPDGVMNRLRDDGFEVGVHGLYHDGQLYKSRQIFGERAVKINSYIKAWSAVGFRSPAMHHNLEWLHDLEVLYDASTFDTDPFEPQPDGMQTIWPFTVTDQAGRHQYVELPYTLAQDFTLFVLMQETEISIWTQKLAWIAGHHGMALINTHPDYMDFGDGDHSSETYPIQYYIDFLQHLQAQYNAGYWHALPAAVAQYWKEATHPGPASAVQNGTPYSAACQTTTLCAE